MVFIDGHISEIGSYEELLYQDKDFAQFLKTYLTDNYDSEDKQNPHRESFIG